MRPALVFYRLVVPPMSTPAHHRRFAPIAAAVKEKGIRRAKEGSKRS
jgi:hypothetical protein